MNYGSVSMLPFSTEILCLQIKTWIMTYEVVLNKGKGLSFEQKWDKETRHE